MLKNRKAGKLRKIRNPETVVIEKNHEPSNIGFLPILSASFPRGIDESPQERL